MFTMSDLMAIVAYHVPEGTKLAYREFPPRPLQLTGWWRRVWNAMRGEVTWEMKPRMGVVEVYLIVDEMTSLDLPAIQEAVDQVRPMAVVVDLIPVMGWS